MTPARLVELVARALGRRPNSYELESWGPVLERVNDDDADQALIAHRAASPHPAQPADVLRNAIAIANDRAMRRPVEKVEGVPPTPEFLAELERIRARAAAKAEREPTGARSSLADAVPSGPS